MSNALEIKGLTKTFDGFKLDAIDLTLPAGCIMGLVGENGAGKSTTIKLIFDMMRRDSGSIRILGRDNKCELHLVKEDIGLVTDEVGIHECLTAVQVGKIMKGTFKRWNSAEYARLIKQLAVPDGKPFGELSRGMRMKLGIAVAMSHGAKLLILDEATSGLDPVARDELLDMLFDFTRSEENSVLISSHIVSDLEKICDYIAFLHRGRLILCEEKDRLKAEYGIIRCSEEDLAALPVKAVKYKKSNPYGVEAVVTRRHIPYEYENEISPISIEELFVFTVKGDR